MTDPRHLSLARPLLALLLGIGLLPLGAGPAAAAEWTERPTRYTVVYHPPELANTAEQLAAIVDPIVEQMAALHEYPLGAPLGVRLYAGVEAYAQTSELARTPYGQIGQAASQPRELALAEPRLRNLTPEQIRNLFRRGLSQLMLAELTKGKLPVGLLQGAAQYSETPGAEAEVNARALDKARRERAMLAWAELNTPERFAAQSEVAAAESYAVVAFLLDRHGLVGWQRFLKALPAAPDYGAALSQAYGRPMADLEKDWLDYLPEYFGGSFRLNYFARYDLGAARAHLTAGRYHDARDELETVIKFIAGAGRVAKEAEIRDLARQINVGLEGETLLVQGHLQMATFEYAAARESYAQARQRFESVGASEKVTEVDQATAGAESGVTALNQLGAAHRLLAELNYNDARAAALAASTAFAALGDEAHYRQSWAILQELNTTQTRLAYGLALLGLLYVGWSFWWLRRQAQRRVMPGVLR